MRTLLAAAVLAVVAAPTWAQIYKSTDEDGNVVFTDTPPPDAPATQQVELQRTNTAPPPPDLPRVSADSNDKPEAAAIPKAIITAPANDTTFPVGYTGNFSVSAHVDPPLSRGEGLRLTVDGEPQGGPQASGFWDLNNVYRGTHNLVVEVVDADGEVLSSSEPVQVHVMRTSAN